MLTNPKSRVFHRLPDMAGGTPAPLLLLALLLALSACPAFGQDGALPGTKAFTLEGDLSVQMVSGVDRFLMRELERSIQERPTRWQRDFSSPEAYDKSVQPN